MQGRVAPSSQTRLSVIGFSVAVWGECSLFSPFFLRLSLCYFSFLFFFFFSTAHFFDGALCSTGRRALRAPC
ncbi:hypothetical protein C8R47DRAFT_1163266 [Mycena vitilis]|nr:hypothetical protein C8R47DRAFT_1163266 [Mycena vitilis]